ncbi:uncharacterized protein LOC132832448 [Hemiscyllium ocellatum]|uniref:uncharacterized protein LOC132832448 n=1 Tax=Hemiscyllium ocellatum TaxID=170820 RepID=UPI002966A9D0|nr:uncharacterized protein LOC132832448 [Hemiscyllium ocellatum]
MMLKSFPEVLQTQSGDSGQHNQTSQHNTTMQSTTAGNGNEVIHALSGSDFEESGDWLTRNTVPISIILGFAIGIVSACCCLYLFKRRIDACADSICLRHYPRRHQEPSRKAGDSPSQGSGIVYAQLNITISGEEPPEHSRATPTKTHSEDVGQAGCCSSAFPTDTHGICSGAEQRHTESTRQVSFRHRPTDFSAEGACEYASICKTSG